MNKGIYQIHFIDLDNTQKNSEVIRKRILEMGENIAKDLDLKTILVNAYENQNLFVSKGYSKINGFQKFKSHCNRLRIMGDMDYYLIKKVK